MKSYILIRLLEVAGLGKALFANWGVDEAPESAVGAREVGVPNPRKTDLTASAAERAFAFVVSR